MRITLKRIQALRSDDGLSLAEVLVAVGLTGLLALGCTQLALASFTSANYTQAVAVKSLNTGNANRLVTGDMETATGFLVPSTASNPTAQSVCTSGVLAALAIGQVKPLISLQYANGSEVGYEVRTDSGSGALWRVSCPSNGLATGSEMMVRGSLPIATDPIWNGAVKCATFPTGGSLTATDCSPDVWLTSITDSPGIIFAIPATASHTSAPIATQLIVAARNIG
jgi:hypothetical protein